MNANHNENKNDFQTSKKNEFEIKGNGKLQIAIDLRSIIQKKKSH